VLLLDRYILVRFLVNFLTLFLLLYVFATSIDVILSLDDFVKVARLVVGEESGWLRFGGELVWLIVHFQAPRIFQFYAYLHGLAAIGAMGFTLAQMVRYRELVAVMASGVSLYRVAMPFIVAVFALNVLQLANQELVLPRLAPLLLRDHAQIGKRSVNEFEVRFTPDGNRALWQAPSFNPQTATLTSPTILERDERGRTLRRISASEAKWSDEEAAWLLTDGVALMRAGTPAGGGRAGNHGSESRGTTSGGTDSLIMSEPVLAYRSDLTPQILMVRNFNQYASMLSLNQISQMLETPTIATRDSLLRFRYSRFSSVLVNLLVLALTLPCFLLREPANLLRQSIMCASLAIPATVGSAIGMMIEMPGIPPAVGVFLPVIVLGFMALFPWTFFRT
jgi:lipopolysaccharide export system permease protein